MVRVILVEGMSLIRGALAALLSAERDIEVVASVGDGEQIAPGAIEPQPDVAVIDIDPVSRASVDATATQIRERFPDCRTIILGTLAKPRDVRRALAIDADGHLSKAVPPEQLADSIRSVARGATVTDVGARVRALRRDESPLTGRECEILRLAADGAPACEIAYRLSLAVGTVRNYLSAIVTKTGARTLIDAIRIADEAGWLEEEAPVAG